ncbi:MAG: hypothetical protein PWP14_2198 [Methanolobus sp.]|nr:hypothetical protein [Methanolobus sp.]
MTNLWIRHLEKTAPEEQERGASFVKMLHSLAREDGSEKGHLTLKRRKLQGRNSRTSGLRKQQFEPACTEEQPLETITADPASVRGDQPPADQCTGMPDGCTELCIWTARSQQGCGTVTDVSQEDHVQLLMLGSGELMLRYNVTGEDVFETTVTSPEEAESLIREDNMTTSRLYPENPEFQWSKK